MKNIGYADTKNKQGSALTDTPLYNKRKVKASARKGAKAFKKFEKAGQIEGEGKNASNNYEYSTKKSRRLKKSANRKLDKAREMGKNMTAEEKKASVKIFNERMKKKKKS